MAPTQRSRGPATPWPWMVGAWGVLVLLAAAQMQFDRLLGSEGTRFGRDLLWTSLGWSYWLLAAPAVWWLAWRWPLGVGGRRVRHGLAHLTASLLIALGHAVPFAAISLVLEPFPGMDTMTLRQAMSAVLSWTLHAEIVLYWAIVGAAEALSSLERARDRERRALQLEGQLTAARLESLRAQLRPHFLFNALNTIAMLIRQQRDGEAVHTVAGLADLLRASLGHGDRVMVPLSEELALVRQYLEIESVRFSDRLTVNIDVEDSLLGLEVPSLVLQPLVENAVRHGLAASETAGEIRVAAQRVDAGLELTVRDDGPGPLAPSPSSHGIGLANTRARLEALYGGEGGLELGREDGITVARVVLPIPATEGAA